ncbi:integrin alpha-PS3-like [Anticarsia gemmatalis]|uniref:integrin alpha-PS3-like n=1 Tax=Anticarsia gemmatalis TaxID=129554 RepID=UPI003F75CB67
MKMYKLSILWYLLFTIKISCASFVFHENTNIMFTPQDDLKVSNDYFGYSVILTTDGLYVGAPKSGESDVDIRTGNVFICPVTEFDEREVKCEKAEDHLYIEFPDVRNDAWFGASMALLAKDKLLITAPRQVVEVGGEYHIQGSGYLATRNRNREMYPFKDASRLHPYIKIDGSRKEYGNESGAFYYAHGQAGFSLTVSKMNTVVFGAPGMLAWTGGMVPYTVNSNTSAVETEMQPITNSYKTMDLEPYDYFGYSVESGIFIKNGSVLYIGGAPRYGLGKGQVLIFKPPKNESESLDIQAKIIGPQVGSYFGATLCTVDIDQDGLDDLLVGAPTYVENLDRSSHDEGAVFIFMTRESNSDFIFEESGHILGSQKSAAKFGSSIADLGDIDGDGFRDIAIGAPYEDDGIGAVYIYKGNTNGLNDNYLQRIQPSDARGFGWSIAKGVDVDKNDCNDLAVGAYVTGTSYVYRCVPTMSVHATIGVASTVNLQRNATTFTAFFNVSSPPIKFKTDVKIELTGRIIVDSKYNRAVITKDAVFNIIAVPGKEEFTEKTINVTFTHDFLKPMIISFELEPFELMTENATTFLPGAARLSEDSTLKASATVHVVKDCGDDLICSPWLHITLNPMDNPYTPGTNQSLGIRLSVKNTAEPAYGLKIKISLPLPPKRVPSTCSHEDLIMICSFPQPFKKEEMLWEIQLEYGLKVTRDIDLLVMTEVLDENYSNVTSEYVKTMKLQVSPEASFKVRGKSAPNDSISISRDALAAGSKIAFTHYFEITNLGPSDFHTLTAIIKIPDKTNLTAPIEGCLETNSDFECIWTIKAKASVLVSLSLKLNISLHEYFLKDIMAYNATSSIYILQSKKGYTSQFRTFRVGTILILQPLNLVWCIIGACILIGIFVLVIIAVMLYKSGFFARTKHNRLKMSKRNRKLSAPLKIVPSAPLEEDSENEIL